MEHGMLSIGMLLSQLQLVFHFQMQLLGISFGFGQDSLGMSMQSVRSSLIVDFRSYLRKST